MAKKKPNIHEKSKEISNIVKEPTIIIKKHRRDKVQGIFSKGQKKRSVKKAKFLKRVEFASSLANAKAGTTSKKHIKRKEKFFFDKINAELDNIEVDQNLADTKRTTSNKPKNKRKVIDEERDKILQVLDNKTFQNNPLLSMQNHILNTQLMEKRSKELSKKYTK